MPIDPRATRDSAGAGPGSPAGGRRLAHWIVGRQEPRRKGHSLHILITGASGLLGGALASRLAADGHHIVAMTGSRPALLADDPGRDGIQVLPTDLRHEQLGLEPAVLEVLATRMDLIVHCAAATGFNHDPATYRAVNVDGTARLLALAERAGPRPIPMLYVSTAYVCGEHDGPVAEAPAGPGARFANGYEASKAEAEHLVLAARHRGLRVAVARPSIVVGAWADGGIARYDNLYGLIRLVTEGRVRTLPAAPGASLDLVPIDHVVHGLAEIAASLGSDGMAATAGPIFHLVSGVPVPVARLRDLALSYKQFQAPRFVTPAEFDPASLGTAEATWYGRVAGMYATYLQRDPRFADGNLRTLSGRACPPVDWAFLHRMIDRCIADGFLRAAPRHPPGQRTSG